MDRINFTGSDLMRFQNSISLDDYDIYVTLSTQLIEYKDTEAVNFMILHNLAKLVFKFSDVKAKSLMSESLSEKSHIREAIFNSTVDLNLFEHYENWKSKLTNKQKLIIWLFCIKEIDHSLDQTTINIFNDQMLQILKFTKEEMINLEVDLNKYNYLSKIFSMFLKV